ncbi:Uncharacterised protein [Mycobacterium tuberculosis]|uniref:Uncharacterized protein n=1 Tax=Mycobacterium tuberculosis TaxID=1773 RepID=A0A916LAC1_MYCTX|nr:Uncharacterised protein [Mycobacterium tuberculosis]
MANPIFRTVTGFTADPPESSPDSWWPTLPRPETSAGVPTPSVLVL